MTLEKLLSKMDANASVAIGAKNGSAFVYFGTAGDLKRINAVFDDIRDEVRMRIPEYEKKIERYILDSPKTDKLTDEERKSMIAHRAQEITSAVNGIKNGRRYLGDYKPAAKRNVMEHYHKELDDCEAIIIAGQEDGKFWMKKEFDKVYM